MFTTIIIINSYTETEIFDCFFLFPVCLISLHNFQVIGTLNLYIPEKMQITFTTAKIQY